MYKRIKQLSVGMKRLLTVISLIMPPIVVVLIGENTEMSTFYFIFVFIAFWIIVRIVLWIYDGFVNQKNDKTT